MARRHRHLVDDRHSPSTYCGLRAERCKTTTHEFLNTCSECCKILNLRLLLGKETVDFLLRTEERMLDLYPVSQRGVTHGPE